MLKKIRKRGKRGACKMIDTNMIFDETQMLYRCAKCKKELIAFECVKQAIDEQLFFKCECGKISYITKESED